MNRSIIRPLSRLHFVAVLVLIPSFAWLAGTPLDRPQPERLIGHLSAFAGIAAGALLWRADHRAGIAFLVWAALIAVRAVWPVPDFATTPVLDGLAILLVFALLYIVHRDVQRSLDEVALSR